MNKQAYTLLHAVDPIGNQDWIPAPSMLPEDLNGQPVTMLRAYREDNPHLHALAQAVMLGGVRMLPRHMLVDPAHPRKKEATMSRPHDIFLAKQAAEGFDPILQHPNLAAKPKGMDELAERKKQYQIGASLGGGLGAVAGLGGGLLAERAIGLRSPMIPAYGALAGASLGSAAGVGAAQLGRFIGKLKRHDRAADDYERQTGTSLPFDVRHPYMARVAPLVASSLMGSAVGHAMAHRHGLSGLQGALLGNVAGSTIGAVLTPGTLAVLQGRRDALLKGKVNQRMLSQSVVDEDTLDEQAMRG
jgi:hypothetical protein